MQYVGVIGFPLGQSISPVFQQAAIDVLGIDLRYERWETSTEGLAERVGVLRGDRYLGSNVTVPHKQAVVPLLDEIDETAEGIGAVNTITKVDGRLKGYNTDAPGFLRALREDGRFEPAGKRALVIGAGGSARAVAYALVTAKVEFLGIAARNADQTRWLRTALEPVTRGIRVFVEEWGSEPMAMAVPTYDLIINCTPVGMRHGRDEGASPLEGVDINPTAFVFDLVYNPRETPLLKQARAAGCPRVLDGLMMLVYQGAAAFELWTGKTAPVDVMRRAAEAAMEYH